MLKKKLFMMFCRQIGFNLEYSEEKWEFISKDQAGGLVDGKLLRIWQR